MKLRLALIAAAFTLAAPAHAAAPRVDADAVLVQDADSGQVLLQRDARERVPIASITKLMTVLLAVEHARPDEVVRISARAAAVGGSTIRLRPGERIRVRDLVMAALIQSANDAANALADHVSTKTGKPFARLMNARARALGLEDTRFVRPDGLDAPGQFSSARDVTKLARAAMRIDLVRRIVLQRSSTIAGGRALYTWNDLLYSFPGLIGVKTGHTSSAGWSQVAAVRRGAVTVYATLLGSSSRSRRNTDLAALLSWALSRYRAVSAVSTDRVYARVRTQYGRDAVPLVARRPLRRVVLAGRPLVERVVARAVVALPVQRGRRLGEVRVYDGRRLLGRRALVAARSVERPGLTGRLAWYGRRTLANLWDDATGWLP